MIKTLCIVTALMACVPFDSSSFAAAEDADWINRCVTDHRDGAETAEIIKNYCVCLNKKRDNNDTSSPRLWEREHLPESTVCCNEVNWK